MIAPWVARKLLDVVDGFTGLVAEQREKPGECPLKLVQFDSNDPYGVIDDASPCRECPRPDSEQYHPRGMTPLLNAARQLIETADERRASVDLDEDNIVAVFTDGVDNASRRWTKAEFLDLITARGGGATGAG